MNLSFTGQLEVERSGLLVQKVTGFERVRGIHLSSVYAKRRRECPSDLK